MRKGLTNVTKWFENVSKNKSWAENFGKARFTKAAFEAVATKQDAKKKEEPKKKEAPKKKEEAPKKKEEEVITGPPKNPLDLLPPSSFNFFDFKTLITNA